MRYRLKRGERSRRNKNVSESILMEIFVADLDPAKKEILLYNYYAICGYMKSSNIQTTVFGVDISTILLPILKSIVDVSSEKIEAPGKFCNYCIQYIQNNYPHYQNILDKYKTDSKDNRPVPDISQAIATDLAKNIIEILKKND